MAVTWTKEQKQVIDLRDRNILVAAAAGSGKTAVLVERIIQMILSKERPVSVDQLLIVTFTEAAAAEMKDRIRAAIEQALEADPTNEHLLLQATLIHSAMITTIHGFCLSVIRDHFPDIDLDPSFRVGESGELDLLKHDVLDLLLEDRYVEGKGEFLDLIAMFGKDKDDKKIEEVILKIYEYSRSYPDSEGWLASCADAYELQDVEELNGSGCAEFAAQYVKHHVEEAKQDYEQALEICRMEDGPYYYESVFESELQDVEQALDSASYGELTSRIGKWKCGTARKKKDLSVSEEKQELAKNRRDRGKKILDGLRDDWCKKSPEKVLSDLRLCVPMVREIIGLVTDFTKRFEQEKRERNLIDFSDMEHYALRILRGTEGSTASVTPAAKEYQERFVEVMIDEYQDSNYIQEAILTAVSAESEGRRNIFRVGDVKQSIYRFRSSRPELFTEKYETYSVTDSDRQRIDLRKNFRSRPEVLDTANAIFERIMQKPLGGVAYDADAKLYFGAEYYPECEEPGMFQTEVLLAERTDAMDPVEMEARMIAGRIRELKETQLVTDKKTGELRPLRYSDIVILLRSTAKMADAMAKELGEQGIPAFAQSRSGYYQTMEIRQVMDYLKVMNNCRQDIPMTAVLASPFVFLSDTELAMIRVAYPYHQDRDHKMQFFEAAVKYAEEGENIPLREKLKKAFEQLDHFRELSDYLSMRELLERILEETGYGDYVAARPNGTQATANLRMLMDQASTFEKSCYKGLFHFIRYVERLEKYEVETGEANVDDELADTVRIMTIHKSKGLEFPVVFVSGTGKGFNFMDTNASVVLHADLGIGIDAVDVKRRTRSRSFVKRVISGKEKCDTIGEELRILYVALTRAKEKLIITGVKKDLEKRLEEEQEHPAKGCLSFAKLVKANGYLDFLLPLLADLEEEGLARVHVVTEEELEREEAKAQWNYAAELQHFLQWDTETVYDPDMKRKIEEEFAYVYPYLDAVMKKQRYTVSEKKRMTWKEEEEGEPVYFPSVEGETAPVPKFMQGVTGEEPAERKGASRGTAYHRVMELLTYKEKANRASLRSTLSEWVEEGRLSKEQADCIYLPNILDFLNSPLGRRIAEAARTGKLKREQPFVLGEEEDGEILMVQGIIDAYFEEDRNLVLVDYKTDRVESEQQLISHYHVQIEEYARALGQLTGKPVTEKWIYSFSLGKAVQVP